MNVANRNVFMVLVQIFTLKAMVIILVCSLYKLFHNKILLFLFFRADLTDSAL